MRPGETHVSGVSRAFVMIILAFDNSLVISLLIIASRLCSRRTSFFISFLSPISFLDIDISRVTSFKKLNIFINSVENNRTKHIENVETGIYNGDYEVY